MTSILRIIFPDFRPQATVENLGAKPVPAPEIDLERFDRDLEEVFDRGQERANAEGAAPSAA